MKKLDRRNLGYEHNDLDRVARLLEKDGNPSAIDYRVRADEAQKVYEHIANLGHLVERLRRSGLIQDIGGDVIDWLLAHNWTPPLYLPLTEGDDQ